MALDDPNAVAHCLREARHALDQAHALASEEHGRTGAVRDAIFGINSTIDALSILIGLRL